MPILGKQSYYHLQVKQLAVNQKIVVLVSDYEKGEEAHNTGEEFPSHYLCIPNMCVVAKLEGF